MGVLAVLTVTALLLSLASAGYGASAATGAEARSCIALGPRFASGRDGNKYILGLVGGAQCGLATTWMRRLAPARVPGPYGSVKVLNGPTGWRCAGFSLPGLAKKAYTGRCAKGASSFSWAPITYTGG
jgi:hypothetical protein